MSLLRKKSPLAMSLKHVPKWRASHDRAEGELKDKLIKDFSAQHKLSEEETRRIAYMARRPRSSEELRYWLSEQLVNCVYGIDEAPWDRDYDDARELAKLILGYCAKRDFRYNCLCDLDVVTNSEAFKRLGLDAEDIVTAAAYAKVWANNR